MAVATDPVIVRPWGLDVELSPYDGDAVGRESIRFECAVTWRGERRELDVDADRYRHSSGLSAWRIVAGRGADMLTDTARVAAQTALRPIVEAWLASDEYAAARRRAFWHALRNVATGRDSDYTTDRLRRLLALHGHELDPPARDRLERAADALDELHALLPVGAYDEGVMR